jgi:hypothetical protein
MNDRKDPSRDNLRRTEPRLGNLDHFDDPGDRRATMRADPADRPPFTNATRQRPPQRRSRMPWIVLAVVVVLAGAGWALTHQSTLSGLLPQTQMNSLLTRADRPTRPASFPAARTARATCTKPRARSIPTTSRR